MKYLRQFMIIILISFAGEVIHFLLPVPMPASIYGLLFMLMLLQTKILPLENIKETGLFLVEAMPVMFIPAAVGLMDAWGQLKPILIPAAVIVTIVTVIVMAVSGHVTQFIIYYEEKRGLPGKKSGSQREKEVHKLVKERRSNE